MGIEVTQNNLEDVLKENNITVLDFWAPWCGPCKMLLPTIDTLSEEYKNDNITIGKVNVDESSDIAVKYGVRGVPTVMFFKDGVEVEGTRIVGAKLKSDYEKVINNLLQN